MTIENEVFDLYENSENEFFLTYINFYTKQNEIKSHGQRRSPQLA